MIRPALFLLPITLLLPACGKPGSEGGEHTISGPMDSRPGNSLPDQPSSSDGKHDRPNDGFPDLDPPELTPEVERGETGARGVLLNWTRAIELREWDQAWLLLPDAEKEKWSRGDFAALFANLQDISVAVSSGRMEGAAGSTYYTAVATISANEADGRPVRYEAEVILRRVNDVPGASAKQLGWHIESVDLDWTH